MSKEIITANPWYGIDLSEYDINDHTGDLMCQALFTFKENNTIDVSYMEDGGSQMQTIENIGTYVVSGNNLETEYGAAAGEGAGHSTMSPLMVTGNEIIWQDQTFYFKNRADAEVFLNYVAPNNAAAISCLKYFPQ